MPKIGEIVSSSEGVLWNVPNFINLFLHKKCEFLSPAVTFYNKQWSLFIPNSSPDTDELIWVGLIISQTDGKDDDLLEDEYVVELGIKDKSHKVVKRCQAEYRNGKYYCERMILFADLQSINRLMLNEEINFYFNILREKGSPRNSSLCEICPNVSDGNWVFRQDLKNLLQMKQVTDIVLKVQDQEFKAHKCILLHRSPVFFEIISHNMSGNLTDVVEINDVDSNIFSDFLCFLYATQINNFSTEKASKLYLISLKYQMNDLKKYCLKHLMENISVENFCDIFFLSIQHEVLVLKEACIRFFIIRSLDLLVSKGWKKFLCENPDICNELYIRKLDYIEQNRFSNDRIANFG